MQVKRLALFAVSAAAAALPADPEAYYDEATNTLSERAAKNDVLLGRTTPQGQVCNADNCLRNLRDARYSSSASLFCSTYIQSTVTDTAYAVATAYDTATVTPDAATVTDRAVVGATVTTGTDTVTVYTTIPPAGPVKRDNAYPPWLSASYPGDRVSSACSCFISSPSPAIHQTVTLTTSTQTLTNTVTGETPTTTITLTSTSTTNVAATATSVITRRCGVVGCGKILSTIEASLEYNTLAKCKARCLAVADCKSYSFGGPLLPVCTLGRVSAKDFYSELSPLFPQCKLTKLYDASCGQ
ncbi:PAN domain-containing protein [Purpureocillium lavendulum]|uniref:PAN domain-containing protein n=1 Tax=Purpureocillium lavendulum TaxID=1247861 RepID=A0AB34G0J7_9HYPO|nr:PAN domain-containing protein [Purpureocillium lavendulum]